MKTFFKFIIVFLALFFLLVNLYTELDQHSDINDDNAQEEYIPCDELSMADTIRQRLINGRSWIEYVNNTGFCSTYDVAYSDVDNAEYNRNRINVEYWNDDADYWRQVYTQIYFDNKDHLQSVQDSLLAIKEQNQLGRDEFATMVVAFVQDIPYEYVIAEDCKGDETAPCNGNVALGIYSPVEFLGRMHGDCDTRTVLLYTLLRNFGYEPLILNSNEYLHSILALDVTSAGEDFEYKGRRYAYWETTNVGWLAGMLPPDMNIKVFRLQFLYTTLFVDYVFVELNQQTISSHFGNAHHGVTVFGFEAIEVAGLRRCYVFLIVLIIKFIGVYGAANQNSDQSQPGPRPPWHLCLRNSLLILHLQIHGHVFADECLLAIHACRHANPAHRKYRDPENVSILAEDAHHDLTFRVAVGAGFVGEQI